MVFCPAACDVNGDFLGLFGRLRFTSFEHLRRPKSSGRGHPGYIRPPQALFGLSRSAFVRTKLFHVLKRVLGIGVAVALAHNLKVYEEAIRDPIEISQSSSVFVEF